MYGTMQQPIIDIKNNKFNVNGMDYPLDSVCRMIDDACRERQSHFADDMKRGEMDETDMSNLWQYYLAVCQMFAKDKDSEEYLKWWCKNEAKRKFKDDLTQMFTAQFANILLSDLKESKEKHRRDELHNEYTLRLLAEREEANIQMRNKVRELMREEYENAIKSGKDVESLAQKFVAVLCHM